MTTIKDIFLIATEIVDSYHINGSLLGCEFCAWRDLCHIMKNATNDILKAGEYH